MKKTNLTYIDDYLSYKKKINNKGLKDQGETYFEYTIDPLLSVKENHVRFYDTYIDVFKKDSISQITTVIIFLVLFFALIWAFIMPFTGFFPEGIGFFKNLIATAIIGFVVIAIFGTLIDNKQEKPAIKQDRIHVQNGEVNRCSDIDFYSLFQRFSKFYNANHLKINIRIEEARIKLENEYKILQALKKKQKEFNDKVYINKSLIKNKEGLEAIEKTKQSIQDNINKQTQLANFCFDHLEKVKKFKKQYEINLSHNEILEDISKIDNTRSTMDDNSQLFDEKDVLNLDITKITMDDDILDTYYHQSLQELKEDEVIQRINDIENMIEATEDLDNI